MAAHAAVTRAAHRRQVGGHAAARRDDALGLRLAGAGPAQEPDADGTDPWAAEVDALIGLAADAVGLGEAGIAARLLDTALRTASGHPSWRLPVRAGWVRAELALACGRPAAAVQPAAEALERALAGGSLRHALKSRIVLVVARAAAGDVDPASALTELDTLAQECRGRGLLPLAWPCDLAAADLLDANNGPRGAADMSPNGAASDATRRRHAAAATVSVLYQQNDPVGRRLMGESPWLPRQLPVTSLLHPDLRHPHDECHSAQHSRMEGTNPP